MSARIVISLRPWAAFVLLLASACEGKELTVFDGNTSGDPSTLAGASGSADSAGTGGTAAPETGGAPVSGGAAPGGGGSGGASGSNPDTGGTSGLAGGSPATSCSGHVAGECPDNWYCMKASCTAATGDCRPRTQICDATPSPVCGCNGVTYLNDCVRQQMGENAEPPGPNGQGRECQETAIPCDKGTDCPALYASCARLVPRGGMCRPSQGTCWVVPAPIDCRKTSNDKLWQECVKMPNSDPLPACVNTCTAIASERPMIGVRDPQTCTGS